MKRHQIFPSTYYNSQDVRDSPLLLTIDYVDMELVGEGDNKKEKPVAHFKEEGSKLLVVSPTKFDAIALIARATTPRTFPGSRLSLKLARLSSRANSSIASISDRRVNRRNPRILTTRSSSKA